MGGSGYPTISAAVQAASHGDTILIHAGTYREEVDLSGKRVTLQPYGDGDQGFFAKILLGALRGKFSPALLLKAGLVIEQHGFGGLTKPDGKQPAWIYGYTAAEVVGKSISIIVLLPPLMR